MERKSVTIYYSNDNVLKNLRKDIRVYYNSNKMNYAILYFDSSKENEIIKYLSDNKLITRIDKSEIPYEKYGF